MELIFAITLFISAALLFGVEPMFAKMILPRLGGSAAVWSVAIAFFQTTLFLGYLYAHILTRYFNFITGVAVHFGVLAIAFLSLPIAVAPAFHDQPPPGGEDLWLIGLFAASVGVPFFAVSATSPLMQAWFARTGLKNAQNPYVLYGASNVGSFAALLAYPFLLEPALTLRQQSHWWTIGFIALAVLIAGCASGVLRSPVPRSREGGRVDIVHRTTARDRASWTLFAFVPAALMVAVTAHIGTDVASAPFLWVVPLALYLVTFVLVFRTREIAVLPVLVRLQPMLTATVAIFMLAIWVPPQISLVVHLAAFFVAAMVCHQALYRRRPAASDLTSFYLYMSLGGALGGVFAALVAPHLFKTVAEYPILLVLALLARPGLFDTTKARSGRRKRCRSSPSARRRLRQASLFGGGVAARPDAASVLRLPRCADRPDPVAGLASGPGPHADCAPFYPRARLRARRRPRRLCAILLWGAQGRRHRGRPRTGPRARHDRPWGRTPDRRRRGRHVGPARAAHLLLRRRDAG